MPYVHLDIGIGAICGPCTYSIGSEGGEGEFKQRCRTLVVSVASEFT